MSALGVSQSAGMTPDLTKVKIAVNSVFELLDRTSEIDPYDQGGKTLKAVRGDIELCNVSFTYPTRPTITIFSDLNLTVEAGKVICRLKIFAMFFLVMILDEVTHYSSDWHLCIQLLHSLKNPMNLIEQFTKKKCLLSVSMNGEIRLPVIHHGPVEFGL